MSILVEGKGEGGHIRSTLPRNENAKKSGCPATTLNHLGLCGMPCSGPSGRDRSDGVRSGNRDHNMACNLHVLPFGAARYVKER